MASKRKAYGLNTPFIDIFPEPIVRTAAPTTSDKNFDYGQVWIHQNGDSRTSYMYGGIDSSDDAVWILAGPGDSDVDTISGDSGTANPDSGNINIVGGTNITTTGASPTGDDMSIDLDDAISLVTSITAPLYTVGSSQLTIQGDSANDVVVTLGDAAGATNFIVEDSTNSDIFTVASSGTITFSALTVTGAFAQTGGTFNVGQDNAANAVNIGGGMTARAIAIGNGTGDHTITIGTSDAGAGTWDSSAGISIDAATASNFTVTGAGEDLTLASAGGRVDISATENTAQAIYLHANGGISETIDLHADQGTGNGSIYLLSDVGGVTIESTGKADASSIILTSGAGGIDADCALQMNLASSQNAADAVSINASAGGMELIAAGASGQDLDLTCTSGSVNITAGEAIADSIKVQSAAGGLDVDCALQMNLATSQNAANAMVLTASAGGIDITAAGAADEDIDITCTDGSINITSGEDDAGSLIIQANGGTSEKVQIISAQGTDTDSIFLSSVAGGFTANVALASADAINLTASAGGVDIDGALQVNIASSQNAADAVSINSSAGGMELVAAGADGEDIDITCTAGSVNITAGESAADAIVIDASGAAGAIQLNSGTGGVVLDSGVTVNVTSINNGDTPYTILGSDYVVSTNTSAGVVTIKLPAAPATGRTVVLVDEGGAAGSNNITIDGNGNNIAGSGTLAATDTIDSNYGTSTLYFNGTFWNSLDVA